MRTKAGQVSKACTVPMILAELWEHLWFVPILKTRKIVQLHELYRDTQQHIRFWMGTKSGKKWWFNDVLFLHKGKKLLKNSPASVLWTAFLVVAYCLKTTIFSL